MDWYQILGIAGEAVLGAEPEPAYNRVLLSPLLAGEIGLADVAMKPRAWYAAKLWKAGRKSANGLRAQCMSTAALLRCSSSCSVTSP